MVLQEPKNQLLDIDSIQLDRNNPRIQRVLDTYGSFVDDAKIALALSEGSNGDEKTSVTSKSSDTTFEKLKNSIIINKGIITPIVINRCDDIYICVEGNTRLLIYRMLRDSKGDEHWRSIPCRIYEGAGQQEMDAIRLQAHLIGPRQWDPYSKARYITYLWKEKYMTQEQIIAWCGGNKRQIRDSMDAYWMVENVYKRNLKHPEDFNHKLFSGFVEYQDRRIKEAVNQANYSDKQFSKWLHDGKFNRLEHVRRLPEILQHDEAKTAFVKYGSNEALKILNEPSLEELMRKHDIQHILDAVRQKISRFDYEDMEGYKSQSDSLIPVIDGAMEEITDFRNDITKN